MTPNTTIVWFRRDLRLNDNPALASAIDADRLIPLYIHAPHEEGDWAPGAASRWWLHHSLQSLDDDLKRRGSRLIVAAGDSKAVLQTLIERFRVNRVVWNRRYEPAVVERDRDIKQILHAQGVRVDSYNSHLLHEPWSVATRQGHPYRVFTPFWKACVSSESRLALARLDHQLPVPPTDITSMALCDLDLLPRIPWDQGMKRVWTVGEAAALQRLNHFIENHAATYSESRDYPAEEATSQLSPHLCFGEISVARILQTLTEAQSRDQLAPQVAESYVRQLYWREFAYHLLYHFPQSVEQPLNPKFRDFPWRQDAQQLRQWQQGASGIPLADAAMRELWQTGWMHNRMRMVVASLLTKHLGLPWLEGARWFWDTLVDADLANNTLGWQWVAGCGADAAPYYRIFNPVAQSQRFDAEGDYIRRWLPELASLNGADIHQPWQVNTGLPAAVNTYLDNGLKLDLKAGRQQALARYQDLQAGLEKL